MKMAKASERDIEAAGNAMSVLVAIDRGDYPARKGQEDAPDWFDEDDPEHLRRFYDAMKETLDAGPGWPGRVIGGMCYVILFKDNEILDPGSDVIELHPRFVALEKDAERYRFRKAFLARGGVVMWSASGCKFYIPGGDLVGTGMTEEEALDAAMAATQPSKE